MAVEPDYSGVSTSSIESGDEEVSPPSFTKPTDVGILADLFGDMTFGPVTKTDLSQDSDSESFTNFDFTNTTNSIASREVFAGPYDGVTYPEFVECAIATYHQICVITGVGWEEDKESEAFDDFRNPYVDPEDLTSVTESKYIGDEPQENVQLVQEA
jgi:hypothetical protein